MGQYTELVTIADYRVGDRWIGISQILPTVNESTPTNDLTRCVLNFRLGATTFTLDSDDSEVTLVDANTWECAVPAVESFLPRAGKWEFEILFYQDSYTSPWCLYRGTLTVHDDLT